MTAQTRTVITSKFEQGDKPQGTDYQDLIDSFVSIADSTAQSLVSDLTVPTLVATSVITSAISLNTLTFTSAVTTVLSTAQTSGVLSGALQPKVMGLISINVGSTTVALPFFGLGTFF